MLLIIDKQYLPLNINFMSDKEDKSSWNIF